MYLGGKKLQKHGLWSIAFIGAGEAGDVFLVTAMAIGCENLFIARQHGKHASGGCLAHGYQLPTWLSGQPRGRGFEYVPRMAILNFFFTFQSSLNGMCYLFSKIRCITLVFQLFNPTETISTTLVVCAFMADSENQVTIPWIFMTDNTLSISGAQMLGHMMFTQSYPITLTLTLSLILTLNPTLTLDFYNMWPHILHTSPTAIPHKGRSKEHPQNLIALIQVPGNTTPAASSTPIRRCVWVPGAGSLAVSSLCLSCQGSVQP